MARRLARVNPTPALSVSKTFTDDGVVYRIELSTENRHMSLGLPIELPVDTPIGGLCNAKTWDTIALLEDLHGADELRDTSSGGYLLRPTVYYSLAPHQRSLLGLPNPVEPQIRLSTSGTPGLSSFRVTAAVLVGNLGDLSQVAQRKACFYLAGNTVVAVDPASYDLLTLLDEQPLPATEHFRYIARIRTLALKMGAQMDRFLESQRYHFADEVSLGVKVHAPDDVELVPEFPDLSESDQSALKEALDRGQPYAVRGDFGSREWVFPSPEVIRKWPSLKGRRIRGSDVARFFSNPESYLSELEYVIDLSEFSKRVKGIRPYIYRSRPYLRITPIDDGYEVQTGITWDDVLGPVDSPGPDEFVPPPSAAPQVDDSLIDDMVEAQKRGESFVRRGNAWVEVPKNISDFADARKKARQRGLEGKISKAQLAFTLEIYQNIEELEYSDAALEALVGPMHIPDFSLPKSFHGELHDHQVQGAAWLSALSNYGLGGLLADQMGLGKTVQVIALMAKLKQEGRLRPALVVQPKAVIDNWADEIRRFCPGLSVRVHVGPGRVSDPDFLSRWDVVLTTYETLVRDEYDLARVDWTLVICDEAQKIKNMTARRTDIAKAVKARCRIALTGTPVENDLGDLWSIIDFAQPGLLGSYRDFRETYEKPIQHAIQHGDSSAREEAERTLLKRIHLVYRRRTKEECLDLPPLFEHEEPVEFGPEQRDLYESLIQEYHGGSKSRGEFLSLIQRLLQVCSHPGLVDDELFNLPPQSVPKLQRTLDILTEIKRNEEKALIFTDYRRMQIILKQVLSASMGLSRVPVINGETGSRKDIVDEFNRTDGFSVMILSPKAAGFGLNIVGANHVIHYTRWWNPALESQATDRVHRIGQERPVHVYYPTVAQDRRPTVEQLLAARLREKKKLAESTIIPSSALQVTPDDLADGVGP